MLNKLLSELKKRRVDLLFEVFSLFLGLTAALWLDDYRDKKKEHEFNKKMILDIRGEYKDIAKIEKELQNNSKFVDTLQFFAHKTFAEIEKLQLYDAKMLEKIKKEQNGEFSFVNIMSLTKGNFNDSWVSNASWELLSNQNTTSIDYELLKILGEIEGTRKIVEFQTNWITSRYSLYKPLNKYEAIEMLDILRNIQSSKFYLLSNVKVFLEKTKGYDEEK